MKVELQNIVKSFGSLKVLKDLNLSINSGEFACLLGRSGSGKTTILRLLAGLDTPDGGKILFEGQDITSLRTQERHVGWVPQQQLLFPNLSVRDNITYGLKARKFTREQQEKILEETVKLVDAKNLLDREPTTLSGGEKQRVALARAIAPEPKLLLLDEPFSSLDAPERDRLSLAFRDVQLETGITTIHVTHSPREAELLADQIHILANGEILQSGNILDLQSNPGSVEVARILNLPNLVESSTILGIEEPVIIPAEAVITGKGVKATVLTITNSKIYVKLDGIILELNRDQEKFTSGDKISVEVDMAKVQYLV